MNNNDVLGKHSLHQRRCRWCHALAGRSLVLGVLGVAAYLALGSGVAEAPAASKGPNCHASTALGKRPHELLFRVHCNFLVTHLEVEPSVPAVVRAVRHHPRLRGGESQDHFTCHRAHNTAQCSGSMGHEVTLVGALRMHGDRCDTATGFGIQGGVDCEDDGPGTACPSIGYFAKVRDPEPSGCG